MKIDKEISGLFEDIVDWEYESLKADIKEHGINVPLVVSKSDGTIVCGHQRYKIAKELHIPEKDMPVKPVDFKTRQEMIDYAINDNVLRRNLNLYQKALLGLRILPYEKQKAKERIELSWKKRCPKTKEDIDKNAPQNFGSLTGETMKLVADRVGVSHETLRKVQKIEEYNPTYNFDIKMMRLLLKKGETSISAVYNDIKDEEKALLKTKKTRHDLSPETAFDTPDVKIFKTLIDRFDLRNDLTNADAKKEESVFIKNESIAILAKTEDAKKCLAPFANTHVDEKTNKKRYTQKGIDWNKYSGELVQSKFSVRDLSFFLELLKKLDESEVNFKCKNNGPIEISTENFDCIIAPISVKQPPNYCCINKIEKLTKNNMIGNEETATKLVVTRTIGDDMNE